MTSSNNDDFTSNLNERIKELEDMTNEINDQTQELEDQATQAEDVTTQLDDDAMNQAQVARQEGETIFFTANVDTLKPLKLNITNNSGDLNVTGEDIDHVEITATRRRGEDVDHAHWFFQQVDNELTLRPNWQVGSHVGDLASKLKKQLKDGFKSSDWSKKDFTMGLDVSYDIVVRVPQKLADESRINLKTGNGDGELKHVHADVDFKTANGDIKIEDLTGNLILNSANGDLTADTVIGKVVAITASGDVTLNGIDGSVEGNTANGDVKVDGANDWVAIRTANGDAIARNVSLKGGRFATVSGDIMVDGSLVNASDYSFDTVAGEVNLRVRVPAEGATLKAKTVSGDIETHGDWTKTSKNEWVIGEGNGPMLHAKSVNGDISITSTVDADLILINELPTATAPEEKGDEAADAKKDGEININLDIEIERAKGWFKDVSSKLGSLMSDAGSKKSGTETEATGVMAPPAPEAPKPPVSAEVKSATAERRAKLLEAVKSGEMTIDEALTELEQDV